MESIKDKREQAQELVRELKERGLTLALAESCTGGLVSAFLTNVQGASKVFWGSFVCYTLEAKTAMLGLDENALKKYGLVSRETAVSMAVAALKKSTADIAASVTGLAGPGGDGGGLPVGIVWVAAAKRFKNSEKIEVKEFHFSGNREEVRTKAANAVLNLINEKFII